MNKPSPERFRERLRVREPLLGTFIKTPVSHPVEILGGAGLDFVVIDRSMRPSIA